MSDPEDLKPTDANDRTVIMPSPGGRARGGAAANAGRRPAAGGTFGGDSTSVGPDPAVAPTGVSRNPLIAAATTVFALVHRLRSTRQVDDPAALKSQVLQSILSFEKRVRAAGVPQETAFDAKFALSALIDETVLGTPWGFQSDWPNRGTLITFFRGYTPVQAGEKFYEILHESYRHPEGNIDLLEFYYACLSLGYQGRYGRGGGGTPVLHKVRNDVYEAIRRVRGDTVRDLSIHWRGVVDRRPKLSRYLAWWVVPVVALFVMLIGYLALSYPLNDASDQVRARIADLDIPILEIAPPPDYDPQPPESVGLPESLPAPEPLPATPTILEDLRATLADEIAREDLGVFDADATGIGKVVIWNMFPSARADVSDDFLPVVERIGGVLARYPRPFTISGHTDDQPIRTVRFPSNFELSLARAESVRKLLGPYVGNEMLQVQGRAANDPLQDATTAEARARNRRVQIEFAVNY